MDYVIVSGARRQENRWDPKQNLQIVPETKETQKQLFDDSMFKLEHGVADKEAAESKKPHLINLFNRNERTWSDDYTANSKLRNAFRVSISDCFGTHYIYELDLFSLQPFPLFVVFHPSSVVFFCS